MIRALTAFLRNDMERRFREFLFGVAILASATLAAAIGVGFATLAVFGQLRSIEGPVVAATVVAAAYALIAVALAVVWTSRRRASPLRAKAAPPTPPSAGNDERRARSANSPAMTNETALLAEAMKLGGELSTTQLLVLALVGGLVAGRNVPK